MVLDVPEKDPAKNPRPTKPTELHTVTSVSTLPFAFVRSRDRARARAHDFLGSGREAGRAAPAAASLPDSWSMQVGAAAAACSPGPVSTDITMSLAAACGGWVRWRRICATCSPGSDVHY